MNGKGGGWHNESHRHRLASMGIKTTVDMNYGSSGQLNISQASGQRLDALAEKFKTGFAKAKVGLFGTEEEQQAKAKVKEAKERVKEAKAIEREEKYKEITEKLKAGVEKGKELKEEITADVKERTTEAPPMISPRDSKPTAKPKKPKDVVTTTGVPKQVSKAPSKAGTESVKRTAKAVQEYESTIKDITDERGKYETTRPPDKKTSSKQMGIIIKVTGQPGQTRPDINVNQAMMESIDADDIIALAQNKEQLIKYSTALQHDMNKIESERRAMSDEFKNIERTNYKTLQNSRRLQMENSKKEIQNIKIAGYDKHKINNKIKQIKIRNESDFRGKMNVLKDQKRQHRVDLNYADDINKDLKKLHRQIDKRVQMMIASGKAK